MQCRVWFYAKQTTGWLQNLLLICQLKTCGWVVCYIHTKTKSAYTPYTYRVLSEKQLLLTFTVLHYVTIFEFSILLWYKSVKWWQATYLLICVYLCMVKKQQWHFYETFRPTSPPVLFQIITIARFHSPFQCVAYYRYLQLCIWSMQNEKQKSNHTEYSTIISQMKA